VDCKPQTNLPYCALLTYGCLKNKLAQAKWVEDTLISFPCLDGIALDYIRYPTWEQSDKAKLEGVSLTVKAIREVTDRAGVTLLSTFFPP
jgi:hypothetical protein